MQKGSSNYGKQETVAVLYAVHSDSVPQDRPFCMKGDMMHEEKKCSSDAAFWNSIAKPCSAYERRSAYAGEFLQKSGILPGESVFDMGCGSGTLCLPLADDGHRVFCGDFSEKMLQSVTDTVREEGITLIKTELLSWQEDWETRDLPVCDLAFASRCLFDVDPADAVKKLSAHARRKVCITLPVNASMFKNPKAAYTVGENGDRREYLLSFLKVLYESGYFPEVSYMTGRDGGKGWAFISWDTHPVTEEHHPLLSD